MIAQRPEYELVSPKTAIKRMVVGALRGRGLALVHVRAFNYSARMEGRDWPLYADTMIGMRRLDNLHACVRDVLARDIPGDLVEAGVWRGGATIFMRGALEAYGDPTRCVWAADSYEGLPPPDATRYPADANDQFWTYERLRVPLEEVKANFERYGLLDGRVRFLKGWFRDTLPEAPISALSVIRLDGDMYESTMDGLTHLYPKLSPGGYVIIDDYGVVPGCRQAVEDYRADHHITEPVMAIDWSGVFWQKSV
jgi:O-methyltransferase